MEQHIPKAKKAIERYRQRIFVEVYDIFFEAGCGPEVPKAKHVLAKCTLDQPGSLAAADMILVSGDATHVECYNSGYPLLEDCLYEA